MIVRRELLVLFVVCALVGIVTAGIVTRGVGAAAGGDGPTSTETNGNATSEDDAAENATTGSGGVAAAPGTERVLVVADADTGESVLVLPVEEGTSVALAYTHSVEKTPVRDVYAVDGSQLEMTEMRFRSYGAGLPSRANVTEEGGWFVFDPPGRYRQVTVHPGSVAGHELVIGDDRYDLVELSSGESVELFVTTRCANEP